MVLNKLRRALEPLTESAGRRLGEAGISAGSLTLAGFALAVLAGLLYAEQPKSPYIAGVALIGAGLFDLLDGSVARASRSVTKTGSFADSTLDRLAEFAAYTGIVFGGEAPAGLAITVLGCSFMVSYMRAKGESLGARVSGMGVGERAERLIVLIAFSLAGLVTYGLYLILALAVITIAQRYYGIARQLAPPAASG